MIDELWDSHAFRTLLDDLLKSKSKGEEVVKMRLEILIDYLVREGKSPAPSEPGPDEFDEEDIKPSGKAVITDDPNGVKKRRKEITSMILKASDGKVGQFAVPIPMDYDVQKLQFDLIESGIHDIQVGDIGFGAPNLSSIGSLDDNGDAGAVGLRTNQNAWIVQLHKG